MNQVIAIDQELKTELNRDILMNYGSRLFISQVNKKGSNFELKLDYRRVIHILDSYTDTIYVRRITFPSIFDGDVDLNKTIKLPLDEINKSIENKYVDLRTNIARGIICNKNIILPLIKTVPLFSAFLNKFNGLISALVYSGIIEVDKLNERLESDPRFKRYFDVIVNSGYAKYDKSGNLKQSEKLKILHKDMIDDKKVKYRTKDVIDEIMFNVIKENYEYIIHNLKLKILRTFVNLLACLNYVTKQSQVNKISMKSSDLFRIYKMLYGKIIEFKFDERLNYLASSGIINKEKSIVTWSNLDVQGT